MLHQDRVYCDHCLTPMGKLWALPAQAPRLLAAPRFDYCPDCRSRLARPVEREVRQ